MAKKLHIGTLAPYDEAFHQTWKIYGSVTLNAIEMRNLES